MLKKLTVYQQETLDFIRSFISTKRYPPTYREIGEGLGVSARVAYDRCMALNKKGHVDFKDGIPRSMRPVRRSAVRVTKPHADFQVGDDLIVREMDNYEDGDTVVFCDGQIGIFEKVAKTHEVLGKITAVCREIE